MNNTPTIAPTPHWWPGRTKVIISAVLAALAIPLLIYTVALAAVPCHRNDHLGNGSDYCEDATLFAALGLMFGTITLVVGGSMAMGAAGLFLRPGLRGRVMLIIGGLIIGTPVVFLVALKLIWIPLR